MKPKNVTKHGKPIHTTMKKCPMNPMHPEMEKSHMQPLTKPVNRAPRTRPQGGGGGMPQA